MAIKQVIVHVVKRDKNGDEVKSNLRETVNKVEALSTQLTDDLLDLFSSASLNFGEFGLDGDNAKQPAFEQNIINNYNEQLVCNNFAPFTKALALSYKKAISTVPNAKGGYLVFYQYEYRNHDWLGIAVLQRNSGVDVSDNTNDLIKSNVLDVSKLHLGAAINLTLWKYGVSTRYIRFKTGLSNEVRDYFEKFIGCQRDKEAAKIETQNLRKAIIEHGKSLGLEPDDVQDKLTTAQGIIKSTPKEDPVLLTTLANAVFPEDPQAFCQKAKDDYLLSEELLINTTELARFNKISGKSKLLSLTFDRKILGNGVVFEPANEDIDGEDAKDKLVITSIPYALKQAILEEMKYREANPEAIKE
jgi:nucleoid-associated protein